MKNLFALGLVTLLISSSWTYAKDLECVDRTVQDATFSATFTNLDSSNPKVSLFVPLEEATGMRFSATCMPIRGTDEPAYTCSVLTGPNSGYDVELYSSSSSDWVSFVTPWPPSNKGARITIPCDKP
jgi:hypothetical protein